MCDWMLPLMLHNTVFSLDVATVRRGRMSTVNVFFFIERRFKALRILFLLLLLLLITKLLLEALPLYNGFQN